MNLIEFLKEEWSSEQRHGLQVLLDDCVHNHLENYLNVGGVCCCGEVVVDEFAGRRVETHKHCGDEPGGSIHVTVSSFELGKVMPQMTPGAENLLLEKINLVHE